MFLFSPDLSTLERRLLLITACRYLCRESSRIRLDNSALNELGLDLHHFQDREKLSRAVQSLFALKCTDLFPDEQFDPAFDDFFFENLYLEEWDQSLVAELSEEAMRGLNDWMFSSPAKKSFDEIPDF